MLNTIFALIFCKKKKKKIYRIDRGPETAVYQAWLLKKKSDLQFFVKKIWLQMVRKKKSSFNINWKN